MYRFANLCLNMLPSIRGSESACHLDYEYFHASLPSVVAFFGSPSEHDSGACSNTSHDGAFTT